MENRPIHPFLLNRRRFLQAAGGTLGLSMLAACTAAEPAAQPATANSDAPQAGGTLRTAFPEPIEQLDPAFMVNIAELSLAHTIYDRLTWVDEALTLQPRLATAWEADETFTTWTFTLRDDVTFHNGDPLMAKDVVYSYNRLRDPDLGALLYEHFKSSRM